MFLYYKIQNGLLRLKWDSFPNAHHYRIMAMSPTFVYYAIKTVGGLSYNIPFDNYSSNIRFKIIAESANDNKLSESNEVNILFPNIEFFQITALNGYNGTTLAFRSKRVYDLYKIYGKTGLIAETEDPVLELLYKVDKNKLNEIIVEGYFKEDDAYVLGGISNGIAKLPHRGKSDYKISIIIPVYNAEIFLTRTIDSVVSSSMTDIEIILVDDGSTDHSMKICKWYAKKFPCISIIHQKNQGVAVARNKGMSVSQGEYLGFVDNDDIVHPLMYENLYNACKIKNTDIAIAPTIVRNDVNNKEICLGMPGKKENIIVYTYEEMIHNKNNKDNIYFVAIRNKIVRTSVARKVQFPTNYPNNIILYEDSAYTPALYSYINRFSLCKDAYYIWDKRKQKTLGTASTMHRNESNDNIWKAFIYAYSYPLYNRCDKNKNLSDYSNFKRLIESYDKFKTPSALLNYWNEKLTELVNRQKLYENNLIMGNSHLKYIVNKFRI